ncbi:MAG: hypothetical protein B6244_11925 [Candidatus Cloacimonetes bacterium 4572_55]|nr:MAG: hypothetical protein B6244_11925 [Candidatus Cloacimonetes bacterium 4572_55]
MHIIHLNEIGGFFGGAEQYVYRLAKGLAKAGHTSSYLYTNADGIDPDRFFEPFIDPIFLPTPEKLKAYLQQHNFDLIIIHKLDHVLFLESCSRFYPSLKIVHDVAAVCPRKHKYFHFSGLSCKYPVGWRCYPCGGFLARNREGFLPVKFVRIGAKFKEIAINKRFNILLAPSEYIRQELIQNAIPSHKTLVIPYGIDAPEEPPLRLKEPDPPHIMFAGSILRGKGVDLLLKAAAQLEQPFHLDLIGQGNGMAKYKALAKKLGLNDQVTFHGWLPQENLKHFYLSSRVVAFSSRAPESFGLIGIEAMAHCLPIVGFDVGGVSTWLKNRINGFLIPEGNIDQFSQRLDELLGDADFARNLGKKGHNFLLKNFTFDRYMKKFLRLIDDLTHDF